MKQIKNKNFDTKILKNNKTIKIEESFANFTIANIKDMINDFSNRNIAIDLYALLIEIFSLNKTDENKVIVYDLYYLSETEGSLKHADLSI